MTDPTPTAEKDALREAAAWVAEMGYPLDFGSDTPMPDALWSALVDHVHADESGRWHGNSLDREGVESWLADEAGRPLPPGEGQPRVIPPVPCEKCGGVWEHEADCPFLSPPPRPRH